MRKKRNNDYERVNAFFDSDEYQRQLQVWVKKDTAIKQSIEVLQEQRTRLFRELHNGILDNIK